MALELDYITERDAIKTLLNDNLATLNTGISPTVKQIITANPMTYPVPSTMYPSILIRLDSKDEIFTSIGGGRKEATLHFSIFGIVQKVKSAQDSDDESIRLARNIEKVFRNNIDITGSVAYSNPASTDFGIMEEKGGFVSVVQIKLDCVKKIQ